MSLFVLAAIANGVLERLWPSGPPRLTVSEAADRLNDHEAEYGELEPREQTSDEIVAAFNAHEDKREQLAADLRDAVSDCYDHYPSGVKHQLPLPDWDDDVYLGFDWLAAADALIREYHITPKAASPSAPFRTGRGVSPSGGGGLSSAGGALPPASPAELPPVEWLAVAVKEELAHHHYRLSSEGCDCGDVDHLRPMDPYDWREHVSPIVTATVLKCIAGYGEKK